MAALIAAVTLTAPAAAHPPYSLVADPAGNVYFSDLEAVWRLTPDGQLSVFRPGVAETHVHELVLTADGAIEGDQNRYDPATQRSFTGLWRRTLNGAERDVVPMTGQPPLGTGVWQDAAGNRYTAQWLSNTDRRTALRRRSRDGRVKVLFDQAAGAARPPQPSVASVGGMAFRPDGSLIFADGGKLRRLAPSGNVSVIYDGGGRSSLRGLATTPDGAVLAADMMSKAVLAVGADGRVATLYREKDEWVPAAVALAGGRLLVLEANADPREYEDRVRVIEVSDGRGRVIARPAKPQAAPPRIAPSKAEGARPSTGMILLVTLAAAAVAVATWRHFVARRAG